MIKRYLPLLALSMGLGSVTLAVWAASAPENDWKITGPFGGTATTLAIDPKDSNVILAGGMNSLLFQSENSGTSWNVLNFPKRTLGEVSSILIDPSDSKHYLAGMIAAEGGGLFESQDAGKTWDGVKGMQGFGVRSITAAASKPTRFVAGTFRGAMLSDDCGKTWARISDPQNQEMQTVTAVAIDTKDPNVIYAGTSHLPWKTTDGGKTWESIHTGMIDDSDVFSIYVNPSTPNSILASACSGIYSSIDRGDLWHKLMGIPNTSRRTHVIREDPLNASIIYAGTTTGLFKSLDRGATWKTLSNTQVNALAFDPLHPQNMFLALEYEGVGKSNNGAGQINLSVNGFVDRVISSVTISGNKLVAIEPQVGETSGVFVSTDRGESWAQLRNTRGLGGVHLRAIAGLKSEDRILIAASPHQMYKSIDAGVTWKPLPVRLIENPPAQPEKPKQEAKSTRPVARGKQVPRARTAAAVKPKPIIKEISPSEVSGLYTLKRGTKDVLFAATDLGLLRSEDLAEHWTLAEVPGSFAVTALYSAPNSDGHLIMRAAGGLYVSKDYGDHWTAMPFPVPASDVKDVAIPADETSPVLVATRVGLYASPDWGTKWFSNPGHMPASTVSSVIYANSEDTAYAVQYGRLFESKDNANSWSEVSTALPSLQIRQLWMPETDSKRLFALTSDLGIILRN
jgi:photosystem II stability/assembly factor-like uncharacterized protein